MTSSCKNILHGLFYAAIAIGVWSGALVLFGACVFAGLAETFAVGHLILIGSGMMWAS
ncbi:hypothetical protein [Aquamicrobium defluvii]|uniref:hypothetical protein n=1 Tax=Aquamicrobium defluvii TaxID=69279 RepID=UPI000B00A7B7|nr:hypothetical protein [Aquamicrobium defluvii]